MTVDERLEKLTERHEALTHTIELMAHENRQQYAEWRERGVKLDKRIAALLEIAELHQHRLDSHNDRLDKLEGTA